MIASPRRSAPAPTPARVLASAMATAAVLALLAACASGTPEDDTTTSPPVPCATSTDSDCTPPSPTPTDTATETSGPADGLPDGAEQNLADAVSSGNTQAVEGYLADPTRVVIAASEADTQESPVDAVLALDYVQPGVGSWDFGLDAATLAQYAGNPIYGQFFPADAVVGRSDSGAVVVFVPDGDRIGTIFMSIDEALITDY